jgi:hypothetical protein
MTAARDAESEQLLLRYVHDRSSNASGGKEEADEIAAEAWRRPPPTCRGMGRRLP